MADLDPVRRRFIFGLCLIIVVVMCWVAGDAITKTIFKNSEFDKPFFVVYFKSAMFTLYLLKLLKFVPGMFRRVFAPNRNPDDLLGPSSYEKLEYSEDEGSEMLSGDEGSPDEITINYLEPSTVKPPSPTRPRKSALKKPSSSNSSSKLETSFRTAASPSLSPNGSVSNLESSTASRRIKFRNVAEVRCLASHDITLQREARRPYNCRSAHDRLTFRQHMYAALIYTCLWFVSNYFNVMALSKAELSYVEILSATSAVFVLFLGAAFPVGHVDRISLSKILSVVLAFVGVVLLCLSTKKAGPGLDALPLHVRAVTITGDDDDDDDEPDNTEDDLFGSMFAIASAFVYAVYVIYFRKVAGGPNGEDDKVDIVLFFGTVGALSTVLLLPLFPILHYSDIETFEFPEGKELKYLVITALIGTVLSDLLWLWSTLLTSSLVATVGLALTTPISILVDTFVNKDSFSLQFFFGAGLIVLSFIFLNLLSMGNYSDPALDLITKVYNKVKTRFRHPERDEVSALLNENTSVDGDV